MGALCIVAMLVLMWAFGHMAPAPSQFWLIALGGFVMTCTVGPVVAVVIDVVHPGVRARPELRSWRCSRTYSVLPPDRLSGVLSDAFGLETALTVIPAFGLLAAFFTLAARTQEADIHQVEDVHVEVDRSGSVAQPA